jgi:PLP dependent protein
LADAGCLDLGESRPQELWNKAAALADLPIRWHLIGHLQRNKVERTLPLATLIHSVDSLRLLAAIDAAAGAAGRTVPMLLEVNISGDRTKHGFMPDEMPARIAEAVKFSHVQIRGLMTMAALEGGHERAKLDFRALRQLRDQLRQTAATGLTLDELSMGMSDDFEVAIEEGATLIRIGSALFEEIERQGP